jgi:peptidoglycan hydrolase-like protein with peptidoglycan-binding domain
MKSKTVVLITAILSGTIGLGVPSIWAQYTPQTGPSKPGIPERMQTPGQETGPMSSSHISSEDIKAVKEALKAKGLNPGPINGTLDSKTQQALRDFQKTNDLPVTGTIDPKTASKLGVALGGKGSIGDAAPR